MDSKAVIVASCWIAVAIIASMYLYVGGVNWGTNIIVGLLVVVAFILTFGLTFGLGGMRQESPLAKAKIQTSLELTEIKATMSELAKKVDVIQKELET
ncbi:MAG: hypothetical protein NWF05_09945 [Candidatus Bathyarchaeota archaeon]|nr:hypothetical protein [Candidatus Bathyarchaeota archaeon]